MVVDTSALMAILQDEPDRGALTDALLAAPSRRLSAATLVEAGIVVEGRHGGGVRRLDTLLSQTRVEVVPLTAAHAAAARDAFRRG